MNIAVHHLSPGVAWVTSSNDWVLLTSATGCLFAGDVELALQVMGALGPSSEMDPDLPRFLEDYDFSLNVTKIAFQLDDAPAIVHCNLFINEDAPDDAEALLPVTLLPVLSETLHDDSHYQTFRLQLHPIRMNVYEDAQGGRELGGDAWFAPFMPPSLVPRTARKAAE